MGTRGNTVILLPTCLLLVIVSLAHAEKPDYNIEISLAERVIGDEGTGDPYEEESEDLVVHKPTGNGTENLYDVSASKPFVHRLPVTSKSNSSGWPLERVPIADSKYGNQSSKMMKQNLTMNRYHLSDILLTTTEIPIEIRSSDNEEYTVTFYNGDIVNIPEGADIHLTWINENDVAFPEFTFQVENGGIRRRDNQTFSFQLPESFGDIASLNIWIDGTHRHRLKSIDLTKVSTEETWEFEFPVDDEAIELPDGPDYVATFLTADLPEAGSVNAILFIISDSASITTTRKVTYRIKGEFFPGTNRSVAFTVPAEFGSVVRIWVKVDYVNPKYNRTDNWILESVTVANNQSHQQFTSIMNMEMNIFHPDTTNSTTTPNIPNDQWSVSYNCITYKCGDIEITEVKSNDYKVTLEVDILKNVPGNAILSFEGKGDRDHSTAVIRRSFSGNSEGREDILFDFSVPRGFGPIVKFILRVETNNSTVRLHGVTITNKGSGRRQFLDVGADIDSGRDYAYDIEPISCDNTVAKIFDLE